MTTQSNAMPESSFDSRAIAPPVISATRSMYWSVRRELWEYRSIYIAPLAVAALYLFGLVISAFRLPNKMRAALATLDPMHQTNDPAAIPLRLRLDHGDYFYHRAVLLSRRAVRRTSRSQHSVLEVAAGFRSDHRSLEGQHPAGGYPGAELRAHRGHAVHHAAAQHRCSAGKRRERRDAMDAVVVAPDVADAALPPCDGSCRSGMRQSMPGCCWSQAGRGARHSVGRLTAARDRCRREDCFQHFAFRCHAERPHKW